MNLRARRWLIPFDFMRLVLRPHEFCEETAYRGAAIAALKYRD